ncbi:substrate-binding domain-containing protein [Butyricicoccus faecihominis]|uniref:sugar ABC transporter substrate-binding protein n=1 Tax=Butyricicoccus faecihominis TaxID=1712515 RepID=UPI002478D94D|nr:substrate-binding domain-containing protein [Butyricicoccus faecihominis]MCQ5129965.1 substrate-binding domain-containing protein [Butyricicoccus faecihominis]
MKKSILRRGSLFLTATMLLGVLAGCGSTPAPADGGDAANAPAGDTGGEKKSMAIMMHSVADEFIYSVGKKAQEYAESEGYEVSFYNADNEADTQASQINDVIAAGVDCIVLAPVDADAMADSVTAINEANIPVTLIDRTVTEGKFVSVNQADNVQCGYQGATALVDQAKEQGIDIKDLKVLELMGDQASTSGLERSQGFQQAAKELGFTIVSSLPTYWQSDTAYNDTLDAFQADPNINAIYCASDGVMADSVINALDQMQLLKKKGEDGHIIITTVDGTPGVIDYIKDGYIDAACAQPAFQMATDAVDYLGKALDGTEKMDGCFNNALAPVIITTENADSSELWGNNV